MPDLEGGEHVVVYRAVADFRELLAAVAKAKAELKALSGDTTGKAGSAGATDKLKRDLETYTRARVDGANRAALAEELVTKARAAGARQAEQAAQRGLKDQQVAIDLQKAAVELERQLAAAKERTAAAEAEHAKQAKEVTNARSAVKRAQQSLSDRPTGPAAEDASKLQALQQRLAEATARAERAENDRDTTRNALSKARTTQTAMENLFAASQVEPVPVQAPTTKRRPKPAPEPEPAAPAQKPRRSKAEIDADKALIAAEKELEEARRRADEAAVAHAANTKELSSARSAFTRAQKAATDVTDADKLRVALEKVAEVQERVTRAVNARDASKPDLAQARSAQRDAEQAAESLRQVAAQATTAAEARRATKAAVTPQPQQQETAKPALAKQEAAQAAKPVLRRGKVPTAEDLAGLSSDDLVAGMGQYSAKSKTGQALRSESHRRTTNAILNLPERSLDPAPTATPAVAQRDPQEALDKATAKTAAAEEKLASAKDKVAAQEELLADAKRQYLRARGDAERVRDEIQKAATRTGVTLTPEQLAGNKHVRQADDALRGTQQPVKDSHADLVASRELQVAAENALHRARETEAAARSAVPATAHDDELPEAFQRLLEQITETYQQRFRPPAELSGGQTRDLGSGRPVTDPRTQDELVHRLRELNSSVGKEIELRASEVEAVQHSRPPVYRGVAQVPVRDPISSAKFGGGVEAWEEYDRRHGSMGGVKSNSDAAESLFNYMGAGYRDFNKAKRNDGVLPRPSTEAMLHHNYGSEEEFLDARKHLTQSIKDIDEVFSSEGGKLKDDVTVYRGYKTPHKPYQVGQVLHDPAYQSTSFDEEVAHNFGGIGSKPRRGQISHLMEISADKGQEGIHLDNEDERELLLRRGQYQITGAKMDEAYGRKFRSYTARYLNPDEFEDLNKRQTQATNLRGYRSFEAQGDLLRPAPAGPSRELVRQPATVPGELAPADRRKETPAAIVSRLTHEAFPDDDHGRELQRRQLLFGTGTKRLDESETAHLAGLRRASGELDRVIQVPYNSGHKASVAPGEDPKTLITNALNGCAAAIYHREFEDGRQEATLTHFPPDRRDLHLRTFKDLTALGENDEKPVREHVSLVTDARRGGAKELEAGLREILGDQVPFKHHEYDSRDKTAKQSEDFGALLTRLEAGKQPTLSTFMGGTEEVGHGKVPAALTSAPHGLSEAEQDALRGHRELDGGGHDGGGHGGHGGGDSSGGGVISMRRDDLQRFLDEVKKVYEEPNFSHYQGPTSGARQQRFAEEGREHRRFEAEEGELIDDRPPYRPFRPQIDNVAHDRLFTPSSYPGSAGPHGAYNPDFHPQRELGAEHPLEDPEPKAKRSRRATGSESATFDALGGVVRRLTAALVALEKAVQGATKALLRFIATLDLATGDQGRKARSPGTPALPATPSAPGDVDGDSPPTDRPRPAGYRGRRRHSDYRGKRRLVDEPRPRGYEARRRNNEPYRGQRRLDESYRGTRRHDDYEGKRRIPERPDGYEGQRRLVEEQRPDGYQGRRRIPGDYQGRRRIDDDGRPADYVGLRRLLEEMRPAGYRGARRLDEPPAPADYRGTRRIDDVRPTDYRGTRRIDDVRPDDYRGTRRIDDVRPDDYRGVRRLNDVRPRGYQGRRQTGEPVRDAYLSQSSFDAVRAARRRREAKKRASKGERSFANTGRAIGDLFSSGGRERSPKLQDRLSDLQDVIPKLTGKFGYWDKIIIAVTAAVVALVPVIAVAAGAFGSLIAAGTAAAAAIGAFALAAYGQFSQLQTAIKASAESGKPVAQQYQTVVVALKNVQGAYRAFQNATQAPVLQVFTDALNIASKLLPRFTPLANAAGTAIHDAFGMLDAATKSDTFSKFLNFVGTTGVESIRTFATTLLSVGQGLAELVVAFKPFVSFFVNGLASMAASFEHWAASLSTSDKFTAFMTYAMNAAPEVGAAISALVDIIIHLGVAMAPVGAYLLGLIRLFGLLVQVIPTGVIAGLVIGFVTLWAGLKLFNGLLSIIGLIDKFTKSVVLMSVVTKLQSAINAFSAAFPALAKGLGLAAIAADGFKVAMLGLGVLAVVAVAVGALVAVFNAHTAAQEASAEAVRKHRESLLDLAQALRESGGAVTDDVRSGKATEFQANQTVDAKVSSDFFGRANTKKVDFNIADVAQQVGIKPADLTAGAVGDDKRKTANDAQFDAYIADLQKQRQAKQKSLGRGGAQGNPDLENFDKEIAKVKAAKGSYDQLSVSEAEVARVNQQNAALRAVTIAGLTTEADKTRNLQSILVDLAKPNTSQTAITAAISAYDAHTQAVKENQRAQEAAARADLLMKRSIADANQRVTNASQAVTEAQQNERVAQENLTKAREDAAAQLEDYRRTLRDIPLDEEQASINLQRAISDERKARVKPGATALDLRQAKLDRERAQNSYSDTLTDDVRKRTDANVGLTKTVDSSDNVIAAKNALTDAATALSNANTELTRASEDLAPAIQAAKETAQDAQDAWAQATQRVGETELALAQAGAAAGLSNDQIAAMKATIASAEGDHEIRLSLIGADDVQGKLKETAIFLAAIARMTADPTLSWSAAREQAEHDINEKTTTAGANRAASGMGGQGHSHESNNSANDQPTAGFAGRYIKPAATPTPTPTPAPTPTTKKKVRGARALGGAIAGPGTGTSDSIPMNLSNGEHVWTAAEVLAVGGHTMVKAIREAALHRKTAATSPGQYEMAGGLLRAAKVPGRSGGYDPVQLSSAMFTAGLNAATAATPGPVPVSASTRPVVIDNSVHHHGVSTGDITINNPVKEQAGGSLYRQLRRLRRDYD